MFNCCFFTFISQPWVLTPVMSGLITLSLLLFFLNLDELSIVLYQTIFYSFLCLTSIVFGLLHLSNYPTLDTHTVLKIFPRILGFT
jgi:hypothetical protein